MEMRLAAFGVPSRLAILARAGLKDLDEAAASSILLSGIVWTTACSQGNKPILQSFSMELWINDACCPSSIPQLAKVDLIQLNHKLNKTVSHPKKLSLSQWRLKF